MLVIALELGLKEPETRVLQVVNAQEVSAQNDLADVLPTENQLGCVGKLEQWSETFSCHLWKTEEKKFQSE